MSPVQKPLKDKKKNKYCVVLLELQLTDNLSKRERVLANQRRH